MKKGFMLGLATGVILTGTSLVFANSQIQALLNDQIKVTLNGQIQEFKDETTGEVQYPITYHNRTYLPLRNVAQLAGLKVDYDSNTNTAILTSNSEINKNISVSDSVENFDKEIWDELEEISNYNGKTSDETDKEIYDFHKKYYGTTLKLSGTIDGINSEKQIKENDGICIIRISNDYSDESLKASVNGQTSDTAIIQKLLNLKRGKKVTLVGTLPNPDVRYSFPITIELTDVIEE